MTETIEEIRDRVARLRRPGLGDAVAAGLAAVGITPAPVKRITGRPCRCKQRQQKLNEFGAWIGDRLRGR